MSLLSFFKGCGSVLDLCPILVDYSDLPETDEEAFRRDWEALENDFKKCCPMQDYIVPEEQENDQ